MGFIDRLFGSNQPTLDRDRQNPAPPTGDEQALSRYHYMMRTAPPETIEQAHQEAFAKLTPEQRQQLLGVLAQAAPPNERAAVQATSSNDLPGLARAATRAEIRQPGMMERTLGGAGMGFGPSLLGSFAAGFVGSMVAQSFFSAIGGFGDNEVALGDSDTTAMNDGADRHGHDDSGGDDGDPDGGGDFDGGDFDV